MRQPIIAPSILAGDFARLGEECRAMEDAGADWIHVDVMDGHFVPNLTFGPGIARAIRPWVRGRMDVHLMIAPVDPLIGAFLDAGADIITPHLESGPHIHRTLRMIRAGGALAGLAINPGTGIGPLKWLIDDIDMICVMTVDPGFGGQELIPAMVEKIRAIRALADEFSGGRHVTIEVDGGVGVQNAAELMQAGADVLVAGSALFRGGADAYAANVAALRAAATA